MKSATVASLLLIAALSLLPGCNSLDTQTQNVSTGPHAECLVCKTNADLACVDVPITATTPHTDYNGKTYYFCSDDCLKTFLTNPAKYATASAR